MENTNWSTLYLPFQEFVFTQKSDATLTSSWMFLCVFWASRRDGDWCGSEPKGRRGAVFQLQKASFVTQWETTSSRRWKSSFAGETGSDQPLWQPTGHHTSRFDFIQKYLNGWSSRGSGWWILESRRGWWTKRVKFPTLTSSLSNPRLVQILKLDHSVSAVWLWFKYRRINADTDSPSQSLSVSLCVS